MNKLHAKPLHRALFRILRPLARLLLRNGVPYGEFSELVKRAYVEAAMEDFPGKGRKPTDSGAAVMTGLTRKEVKRQREILGGEHTGKLEGLHTNRASRVVSGWVHDSVFQDSDGHPATLAFNGAQGFCELVKKYSGDMPPRSVLNELLRVGMVSMDNDAGKVTLIQRAFVPTEDSEEMLQFFGEDVSDLIATVDHNLVRGEGDEPPFFQRTLTYNNIPPEVVSQWRAYAAEQSQNMLEQMDSWLGPKDRDVSGSQDDAAVQESFRTGISVFYFEEAVSSASKRVRSI
ncbi:DUF6502 family protein [Marinobacter sp. 2_MG-2023]|uniref:DUF6502 family protein n=1 Tax=Marinobacter sp. 2_MG-2023 TaxID=3062679 RepID=UPI0026E1506C|nr:DUF6502 family protein [Marinobacter sp. 2_MG-2023]MDO6442779.1 DUF6502 family protein [Marinobacter sp. 2_MG-2023]